MADCRRRTRISSSLECVLVSGLPSYFSEGAHGSDGNPGPCFPLPIVLPSDLPMGKIVPLVSMRISALVEVSLRLQESLISRKHLWAHATPRSVSPYANGGPNPTTHRNPAAPSSHGRGYFLTSPFWAAQCAHRIICGTCGHSIMSSHSSLLRHPTHLFPPCRQPVSHRSP